MMRRLFLSCLVALGFATFWPGAQGALGAVRGDFNGDGRADLAVGVPLEDVGSIENAGAVQILYGGAGGLSATGNQLWTQDSAGVLDAAEDQDFFGSGLAAADYNGDGRDDLAVGVPGESVRQPFDAAGAVNVLYGGAGGLSASGNQLWTQDSAGILDTAESGDGFGSPLAAGDLNGDGRADLAVGVHGEGIGTIFRAGKVHVLYGGPDGLSASGNQLWSQDTAGVLGVAREDDAFGTALAAGDLNGDGRGDLAVGVPGEDDPDAGAVNVLYGGPDGLSASGNQLWTQDSPGVLDASETGDFFGSPLAVGDLNGDGRADLAVGVPNEDVRQGGDTAGAVNVLYGGPDGLSATGNQFWTQDSPDVINSAETFDTFGSALAAGDLNGDGRADLAVGVPEEDVGGSSQRFAAGAVNVLYGGPDGLSAVGNQAWQQDTAGVFGAAEALDLFGGDLAAGDLNGDGLADLAVGVPEEDVGPGGRSHDAGAVNVLYGGAGGLSASGNQLWNQDGAGILGAAERGDRFGARLAAGGLSLF